MYTSVTTSSLFELAFDSSLIYVAISLLLVILFGCIGGFLISILKGFEQEKKWILPEIKIEGLLKTITIPPLVGMIIFGCLVRNFFPGPLMDSYPSQFAAHLRSICLSTLLIRAGL